MRPETKYAHSEDAYLAYQTLGDGPPDLVAVVQLLSHCDYRWEEPSLSSALRRMATFSRLILFDRRGCGLSDPVPPDRLPTLEQRAQDLEAVLDDVGVERATVAGFSEGGVDAIFFAASRPQRVSSLILCGTWPCFFANESYPIGRSHEEIGPMFDAVLNSWGHGDLLPMVAPSVEGDERIRSWWAMYERLAASPSVARSFLYNALKTDVRDALSAITAPTLVMHRAGDVFAPVAHGRYLAEHIKGAKYLELEGVDHPFHIGNPDPVLSAIEEFVTGTRPSPHHDRILATALFVDIVDSTGRAASVGDAAWRDILETFYNVVRRQLDQFAGTEIDTAGDGLFATFDGPARAIEAACAMRDALSEVGIEIRAGLHAGECEVIAGKVGGITVHTAARIAALANPGELWVSRTIKDLTAGSGVHFENRGTHVLKGIPDDWQLYRATDKPEI